MYHAIGQPGADDRMGLKVPPETFAAQMAWLREAGWRINPVRELIGASLASGKQAAISFDDGYENQLSAARHLQDQGLKGTFFLVTGKPSQSIGGGDYYQDWKLMTRGGWQALAEQGHEIGGHSHRHPGPLTLEPLEQVAQEISDCRTALSTHASQNKAGFSYPHGAFSPEIGKVVQAGGFDYACGSRPGALGKRPDMFYLPRIEVSGHDSMVDFRNKVEGRGELWRILRHDLMRKIWKIQGRV